MRILKYSFIWFFPLIAVCIASQVYGLGVPRTVILDNVPQYYQGKMECGPVSIRMILAYYGINLSKEQIKSEIHTSSKGTHPISLMEYPKSLGFKVEERCGTIDDIIRNIANSRPVLVHQWKTAKTKDIGETSHYRVVIGYDLDSQTIYMRDPSRTGLSSISFQEFNNLWDVQKRKRTSTKNWMLAIYK